MKSFSCPIEVVLLYLQWKSEDLYFQIAFLYQKSSLTGSMCSGVHRNAGFIAVLPLGSPGLQPGLCGASAGEPVSWWTTVPF